MSTNVTDDTKKWVEVIIKDIEWEEIGSFFANDEQSFYQMAMDNDIELPVSCCSWACFVCACNIEEWLESIDVGKLSVPLVDLDEWQVLSCVGWVFSEKFSEWGYHRIVLKKLI